MKTNRPKPHTKLPDTLITVTQFGNAAEAQLARTKLESKKIKSYVVGENFINMMPVYDLALGGIRLMVKNADLEKAVRILDLKTTRNFWVPRKMFLFSYFLSPYVMPILLIPLFLLMFLFHEYVQNYLLVSFDKNLLGAFNFFVFGIYSLVFSKEVAMANKTWVYDISSQGINETALRKAFQFVGLFFIADSVFLVINEKVWFSLSLILLAIISIVLWHIFFLFTSSSAFASGIKMGMGWIKRNAKS